MGDFLTNCDLTFWIRCVNHYPILLSFTLRTGWPQHFNWETSSQLWSGQPTWRSLPTTRSTTSLVHLLLPKLLQPARCQERCQQRLHQGWLGRWTRPAWSRGAGSPCPSTPWLGRSLEIRPSAWRWEEKFKKNWKLQKLSRFGRRRPPSQKDHLVETTASSGDRCYRWRKLLSILSVLSSLHFELMEQELLALPPWNRKLIWE